MQFVKSGLVVKLFLINLIFLNFLSFAASERIEMSAGDKQICLGCLNLVKILRNVKNSSVCETINQTSFLNVVGVNLNQIPKNELMCYEIYYYFYFFMPVHLSDQDRFDELNEYEIFHSTKEKTSQSDCNVCAYLDKCEYYGCSDLVEKKQEKNQLKIIEDDNKFLKINKNFPIVTQPKIIEKNKNNLNSPQNKEIDNLRKKEDKIKHFNLYEMMLNNTKNVSHHNNQLGMKIKIVPSFILNNRKNITSSDKSDEISFLAKSVSRNLNKIKTKLKQETESSSQENLLLEHLDIIKLKMEHMIDEIFNLANIHKAIQEMKKKALSYIISKILHSHMPNEINLTPIRIGTQDNLRDYVNDVKLLSEKFYSILENIQTEIIDNSNKFFEIFDINNINNQDTKNLDISLEYLLSLSQCYNELFLLANSIYESNINTVKNIKKLFDIPKSIQTAQIHMQDSNDKIISSGHSYLENKSNQPVPGLEINHLKKLNNNQDLSGINELNIKNLLKHSLEEQAKKNNSLNHNPTQMGEDGEINMDESANDKNRIIVAEVNFNGNNRTVTNNENILGPKKNIPVNNPPPNQHVFNNLQQNRTVLEIPPLDLNKLSETKVFFERLEKLEKEQEKFNLLLKNATLLENIVGKFQQSSPAIKKEEVEMGEMQEEYDGEEIVDDDSPYNHQEFPIKDFQFLNPHKHKSYGEFQNSHLNDQAQRTRKDIKNHPSFNHSRRHIIEKPETDDDLNLSNLSNLVLDKTKDHAPIVRERRPPPQPRRTIRKIKFRI